MVRNTKQLAILLMAISGVVSAQVGINTEKPRATLHIEGSSKTAPSGTDGILIPKIKNFPTTNPTTKGILVFLEGNEEMMQDPSDATKKIRKYPDNFYFWTGEKWIPFVKDFNKELDETIYSFNGKGMTGGYFNFSSYNKKSEDQFTLSNNTITVGKSGTYFINFFSSIKRGSLTNSPQSNFLYDIEINGTNKFSDFVGFPTGETTTGASISFGTILTLNAGDKIRVKGAGTQGNNTISTGNITYEAYGNNNFVLTFIKD